MAFAHPRADLDVGAGAIDLQRQSGDDPAAMAPARDRLTRAAAPDRALTFLVGGTRNDVNSTGGVALTERVSPRPSSTVPDERVQAAAGALCIDHIQALSAPILS